MTPLETIIVVLLILWALGIFVTPVALVVGSAVHLLLVIVLVLVLYRLLSGRNVI